MLLHSSQKLHPEFDLSMAARIYAAAGFDTDLEGELITSPYDLFSVEALRDRAGLRKGKAIATDVFVFGKGEAPRQDCTKVGGLPYWPADRPWPKNDEGRPYRFLAQFNFADSQDLFPELPGQVLLLLVNEAEDADDDWLWENDQIHFEWLPLGLTPCATFKSALIAGEAGPFYGAIYRSSDYPKASKKAEKSSIPQWYNLPILNGAKIGGLPHFIQSGDDIEGEFLCQLGSIQAAPYAPYPWVNKSEPLGLEFDHRGIYGKKNSIVFGDMGSIYIFRKEDGTLTSSFECY